ncbi:MAG: SGNH/GDSL hydrolase family protein [Nevskiales bacterium]|nr:SGNH/GDSL hydrolase family protein [Nevskiales bacterium]
MPMIYHLAAVALAPVFFIQGKYVRRVTRVLPEPDGERAGTAGGGSRLSVLIAGDSAAAGVGAGHQREALSGHLVAALSARHAVSWKLLAQSGDTSAQLLARLRAEPEGRYDVVVLSVGVNDVTSLTRSTRWTGNLEAIVRLLRERYGAGTIVFSSLPPMHLFPALPNPLRWWLGLRARRFNALMAAFAGGQADCVFLPIPFPPATDFMAEDGFHPGPQAYALWGRHVAEAVGAGVSARMRARAGAPGSGPASPG